MSRINPNQPLLPSVFDRLTARQADSGSGAGTGQLLRELKQAVRRDLEQLLNTRRPPCSWPPDIARELDDSLISYGLPDFSGMNLGPQANREEFRRLIEKVIRRFEPRFKSVRVQLVKSSSAIDRAFRFRIEAILRAEPHPEPVAFDSSLNITTSDFKVMRDSR